MSYVSLSLNSFSIDCSSCSIEEIASYEEAFQDCMGKMIDDDQVRMKVVMDSCLYKTRRGRFGLPIAKLAVDSSEPSKHRKLFSLFDN